MTILTTIQSVEQLLNSTMYHCFSSFNRYVEWGQVVIKVERKLALTDSERIQILNTVIGESNRKKCGWKEVEPWSDKKQVEDRIRTQDGIDTTSAKALSQQTLHNISWFVIHVSVQVLLSGTGNCYFAYQTVSNSIYGSGNLYLSVIFSYFFFKLLKYLQ